MLLIQNGTLHTMEEENPIRADLLIRDGKITKIRPNIQPTKEMTVINKDGDLAIFDGNPLEIASSVRMTIINGEVVWSTE